MSMATLERAIWHEAKRAFKNSKLRLKDILEWKSAEIDLQEGEVVAHLPDNGVWVAIAKKMDKREAP